MRAKSIAIAVRTALKTTVAAMHFLIFPSFLLPKFLAIIREKPPLSPPMKYIKKLKSELVAPIADKASSPKKCPAIAVSARLYAC